MNARILLSLLALLMLANFSGLRAAPPDKAPDKPAPPFPSDETPLPMKAPKQEAPLKTPETAPSPRLDDSTKSFDIIAVAPADGSTPAAGNVEVGFYNHGDRELVLQINDRAVTLGSRYYLQLKLPREFTWREKDGPERKTKVPENANGLEIVFRK